jgi:hypothetical protein
MVGELRNGSGGDCVFKSWLFALDGARGELFGQLRET